MKHILIITAFYLLIQPLVNAQKNNLQPNNSGKDKHKSIVISNINDITEGKTSEERTINWLSTNKQMLNIKNLNDLKLYFSRESLSGSTLRFQQNVNNTPVYQAEIVIHISKNNRVTYVTNDYDAAIQNINTNPSILKNEAYSIAYKKIDVKGNVAFQDIKLLVYNKLDNTKLVYRVIIEPEYPTGSWEILIDANNGEVINAEDKAFYHNHNHKKQPLPKPIPVNGSGMVFNPDPLSVTNNSYAGNYTDNGDATNTQLDAARSSEILFDIDNTAGVFTLKGPYAEIQDFESPNRGLFTQSTGTFNFNRFDNAFEAVNCYYIIDKMMRYINTTLGITLMPYQYSGGVRYDPHGLNGADNSHYVSGSGRIAFGEGGVDDAEDADVIIHELGHGIHDWLTGGNSSQVNGLGEGSGDYWGQSYSRSLGQWTTSDPEYNWFFNWDGHNSFWNGRITNYTALYPGGLVGQIHTDGQIWATSLMRIYDILGKEKVDKAFLEGLAMTGSSTNQQNAAIAVRQAAIDMGYSCADIDVFTQQFTATGYTLPPLNHVLVSLGPDTMICSNSVITLNPGSYSNYLWQDNSTTPNFLVDGNVTGIGTFTFWVDVTKPNECVNRDSVIVNVSVCTEVEEFNVKNISIYPNPTSDYITIKMNEFKPNTSIRLIDNTGKIIKRKQAKSNQEIIELSKLANGIYTIVISIDGNDFTKKIIKQ